MKLPLGLLALAALFGPGVNTYAGDEDTIRVDVVCDLTEAGSAVAKPTPAKPAYYFAKTIGFQESGPVLTGEDPPKTIDVQRALARALASQGYRYASHNLPTMLFLFEWGYKNPNMSSDGKNFANEEEMDRLVFGDRRPNDNRFSLHADELFAAAKATRYYLVISALDCTDWVKDRKAKMVPLWIARVSTELGGGHIMPTVIPLLIQAATPYLGTQTEEPKWVDVPLAPAAPAAAAPGK
jgi:hypothetical protein